MFSAAVSDGCVGQFWTLAGRVALSRSHWSRAAEAFNRSAQLLPSVESTFQLVHVLWELKEHQLCHHLCESRVTTTAAQAMWCAESSLNVHQSARWLLAADLTVF